jgi:DNA-binding NarL/FixJ family response regulator
MQGILGEIIRETLAAEPDVEVIGELTDLRHLAATTDFAPADAVIAFLGHGSTSARSLRRLLRQRRHARVLIVSEDGRWAALYGEAGDRIPIDDPIPSTLVDAIRGPAPLSLSRA